MARGGVLPVFRWIKDDHTSAASWKVYAYEPGTTTLKDTYTDVGAGTANANPVILNSRGEADIYFNGIYKLVIKDDSDVTQDTIDNYMSGVSATATVGDNLLSNGSFEEDVNSDGTADDWTEAEGANGTASLSTTAAEFDHGTQSVKMVVTDGTASNNGEVSYTSDAFIPVTPTRSYKAAILLKGSITTVSVNAKMLWYDAAQAALTGGSVDTDIYDATSSVPTAWTDKTATITPPSGAYFAKAEFSIPASSNAGTVYFDAFSFSEVRGATTFLGLSDTPSAFVTGEVPVIDPVAGASLVFQQGVGGAYSNLKVIRPTAATVDIDADHVDLFHTGDVGAIRAKAVNLTADITASGANGLDTGSESSSTQTWYAIYVIAKADGTVASLLSVSTTVATVTMPTDYIYGRLVGFTNNGTDDNLVDFTQYGRISTYTANLSIATGLTSTTLATQSHITAIPQASGLCSAAWYVGTCDVGGRFMALSSDGTNYKAHAVFKTTQGAAAFNRIPVLSANVSYEVDADTWALLASAFELNI